MKILFSLFAGFVVFVCAPRTSADVLYIDEKFDYPDGDLGNPWVVENNTESATAKVGAAQMFQSYTPEGRQTTLGRPVAGDGMVNAKLPSGSNAGTVSWLQPEQERAILTFDFQYTKLNNGNTVLFVLRGGNNNLAGLRVRGIGRGEAQLDYMTTNSGLSFVELPGTPLLAAETWYRITLDVTVVTKMQTTYNLIKVEQLGDGGGVIFEEESGLTLESRAPFGSPVFFLTSVQGGFPEWSVASVRLAPVP